jgi:hypothetical protein
VATQLQAEQSATAAVAQAVHDATKAVEGVFDTITGAAPVALSLWALIVLYISKTF